MISCKEESSSKPTAPNIPIYPEGQTSENSNGLSFYSEQGDDEFGAAVGKMSEFLIGVPAGDYLLTYQTTFGTFHIVFRAKSSAILHIGLQQDDKIINASLQKGKITASASKAGLIAGIWPSQFVDLFYWPQPNEVPNLWQEWFKAELSQAIEMIINGLVSRLIKELPFPEPSQPAPPAPQPTNPPQRHNCPLKQVQGGDAPETHIVEMFQTEAVFEFRWNMQTVKDQMIVKHNGIPIYDTGCVSGIGSETLHIKPLLGLKSSEVTVEVKPNCAGQKDTVWTFEVDCPKCYFAYKKDNKFKPNDPQQCFGGVGARCENDVPPAPKTLNYDTCTVQAFVAPGSIEHDQCCVDTSDNGVGCLNLDNPISNGIENQPCGAAWKEAWGNVTCGLKWPVTFGTYTWNNPKGTDNLADLRAPAGQDVPESRQSYCNSGRCRAGTTRNRLNPTCGKICTCE